MSKVTLCLIVKNEGLVLEKCLKSIVQIADEIIIVDTGSNDDTIAISKRFTDKVYNFEWIDDFSSARNYAQSLATCEYICRWDGDWILESGSIEKLQLAKNNDFNNADIYELNFVEHYKINDDQSYSPLISQNLFFFYRKDLFIWESPVHNQLVPIAPTYKPTTTTNNDINVFHLRQEANKEWRKTQSTKILKKNLNKNNPKYQRMLFFYARDLYFDEQYNECIKQYQLLLDEDIDDDMKAYIIEKIFFCLFKSKNESLIQDYRYLLNRVSNPKLILLKADLFCLFDKNLALEIYNQYLDNPFLQKNTRFEYDIERYQVHPHIQIAKIQLLKNKKTEAKNHLDIALKKTILNKTKYIISELLSHC
jgi:glycosyltransferase involved in cell wall biosynthesis